MVSNLTDRSSPAEVGNPSGWRDFGGKNKPVSLSDQAYEEIKRRIITLRFRPGEWLNETQVTDLLGIRRTPVHQAFHRLMNEGMVDVIPRKGVVVSPVSLPDILETIELRLLNEPYCVTLAAQRAGKSEIREIEAILRPMKSLIKARNLEALMDLERNFRTCIYRSAKNQLLADFLLRLQDRSLRFWFLTLSDPEHHLNIRSDFTAICEAIKAHDGKAASKHTRANIDAFRKRVLGSM